MKKKNSAIVTLIITVIVVLIAAYVFVQPYLNTTSYTTDKEIAEYLGQAFGKYPRFVNDKDFEKIQVLEIGKNGEYNYISMAFDGFITKRDEYLDAYNTAQKDKKDPPEQPDFSKVLKGYQTENAIEGFVPLENFKDVIELNISSDMIEIGEDLSKLTGMTNLKKLSITKNDTEKNGNISDISALSAFTQMTDVSIPYNMITDISALSGMTNLKNLVLNNNQISDISPLSDKAALQSLTLSGNKITDISVIAEMNELVSVALDENQISDISALNGKEKVTSVSLSKNQIKDITPISTMKSAYIVSLSGNLIEDVSPLTAFKDLTSQVYILLSENKITDWTPLDVLPKNIMIVGKPEAETPKVETPVNDEKTAGTVAEPEAPVIVEPSDTPAAEVPVEPGINVVG